VATTGGIASNNRSLEIISFSLIYQFDYGKDKKIRKMDAAKRGQGKPNDATGPVRGASRGGKRNPADLNNVIEI
jgi:hypothetical protein